MRFGLIRESLGKKKLPQPSQDVTVQLCRYPDMSEEELTLQKQQKDLLVPDHWL